MKKDNTKDKIYMAARRMFSDKGYTRATTREIAKEAGVAEVTLFRYFGTKNNLFYETLSKYLVNNIFNYKIQRNEKNLKIKSLDLMHERIDTLRKNRDLFMCAIYEAQFDDEIKNMLQEIYNKVFNEMKEFFESNEGEVDLIDLEERFQLILSTIIGLVIFESIGTSSTNLNTEKWIDIIRGIVWE